MKLLLILSLSLLPALLGAQTSVLFDNVRVFDGAKAIDRRDVLVREGKIVRIAATISATDGVRVIDGTGKTLLPGLIDAHTHTWGNSLVTALVFGVTTQLDMFTPVDFARTMRSEQQRGPVTTRADLLSAGVLATVPTGHGTQFGTPIPTITSPDSAQAFVDARIAEGSDYIKIVYDDGHTYGISWPLMRPETLRALIDAAHKRGKMAIVHVGDLAGARAAIEAGADGLVHLFVDRAPDSGFGKFVGQRKAFVIPTMTVLRSISGSPGAGDLADDSLMNVYLTGPELTLLKQAFPKRPNAPASSYEAAEATVRQLRASGVRILAGTDAGNPGTGHGIAMHRELELLVKAGLTPVEALAAATSVPAQAFGLSDRGRIAVGMRADLLLVNGDPTREITATRDIASIWKHGVEVDRAAFARTIAAMNATRGAAPANLGDGTVSEFEEGTMASRFGAGWSVSNDAMARGKSTATLSVGDGGALGSAKSLVVRGTISDAVPHAWAGAMFNPGMEMFQPVNLSSKKELRFWARGDGKVYRVFLFAQSRGYAPLTQTFVAGPEWKEYIFPFSAFSGIDGHDLMAVVFGGGPAAGPFEFQLDNVSFR